MSKPKKNKKKQNKDTIMPKPLQLLDMKIDYDIMRRYCLAPMAGFTNMKGVKVYKSGVNKDKLHWFFKREGEASTLAIAHLDSVAHSKHFGVVQFDNDDVVFNGQLDDRLGAYVVMVLLPSLGVTSDVLLTMDEEVGQSTAQYFTPPDDRDYNWIYSFDRQGADVVMYNYHTPERKSMLEEYGFTVAHGSTSDIAKLYDLGITGFNFGVGYHDYHAERAWASMNELRSQVSRFVLLWHDKHNEKLVHTKKSYTTPVHYPTAATPWRDDLPGGGDEWERFRRNHPVGVGSNVVTYDIWMCDCVSDYTRSGTDADCKACGTTRAEYYALINKVGNFMTSSECIWELIQAAQFATGYRSGDAAHEVLISLCTSIGNNSPRRIPELVDFMMSPDMKAKMNISELRTLFFPPGTKLPDRPLQEPIKHPYAGGVYDVTRAVHDLVTGDRKVARVSIPVWDDSLRFTLRIREYLTEHDCQKLIIYLQQCNRIHEYMNYGEIEIVAKYISEGGNITIFSRAMVGRIANVVLDITGKSIQWEDALLLAGEFFKACYGNMKYMQQALDNLYTTSASGETYTFDEVGGALMWSLEVQSAEAEAEIDGEKPEDVESTQPLKIVARDEVQAAGDEKPDDTTQGNNATL